MISRVLGEKSSPQPTSQASSCLDLRITSQSQKLLEINTLITNFSKISRWVANPQLEFKIQEDKCSFYLLELDLLKITPSNHLDMLLLALGMSFFFFLLFFSKPSTDFWRRGFQIFNVSIVHKRSSKFGNFTLKLNQQSLTHLTLNS